jgi:hypothetical protein
MKIPIITNFIYKRKIIKDKKLDFILKKVAKESAAYILSSFISDIGYEEIQDAIHASKEKKWSYNKLGMLLLAKTMKDRLEIINKVDELPEKEWWEQSYKNEHLIRNRDKKFL